MIEKLSRNFSRKPLSCDLWLETFVMSRMQCKKKNFTLKFNIKINFTADFLRVSQIEDVEFIYDSHRQILFLSCLYMYMRTIISTLYRSKICAKNSSAATNAHLLQRGECQRFTIQNILRVIGYAQFLFPCKKLLDVVTHNWTNYFFDQKF